MNGTNKIKFNVIDSQSDYQLLDIKILGDGLISSNILEQIQLPDNLQTNKGVVISGKAPVWLYAFLIHQLHCFSWIATFDPRVGAIVVQNHKPEGRTIGSVIPIYEIIPLIEKARLENEKKKSPPTQLEKLIVVIGGPPHSGKSVFIQALRKKLNEIDSTSFTQNVFIIRACPDGEGDWFGDIPADQGKTIRFPGVFTDDFAIQVASDIENTALTKNIVIVDVGGKLDQKNNLIFSKCNSGIVVSNNKTDISKWVGAFELTELKTLATIHSVLDGETKVLSLSPLEVQISNLDRNKIDEVIIPDEILNIFKSLL